MQHSWWVPASELAKHVLVYSIVFVLFVGEIAYGSIVVGLVARVVASRILIFLIVFLEYAIIITNVLIVTIFLTGDLLRNVRRLK